MNVAEVETEQLKKTRSALIWSSVLNEPLSCLLIWLPFILRKDCHATAWQISLLATLKPIVSLFSFYWPKIANSFGLNHQKSVLLSGFLARFLFLFFPLIESIEFTLFAASMYLFFSRAQVPSWMELLKLNLEPIQRQKWFSLSSMFGYAEGILLAVGFGSLFDHTLIAWRYLFTLSACFGMVGILYQMMIPHVAKETIAQESTFFELLIHPIRDAFELMKKRTDFALFQWGFMFGGFGIMLANVVCPLYFVDVLNLSHVDYAQARYIYMGLGFILFSPLWQKGMQIFSIFGLTLKICLGFAAFVLFMYLSKISHFFLNISFFLYGASQAGSHLIWHLSGPEFAKNEDSSAYSSVNVVMVGIRGLIGPALGSILYIKFGPLVVFALSFLCCLLGGAMMLKEKKRFLLKSQIS
jgi:hypothetical protein